MGDSFAIAMDKAQLECRMREFLAGSSTAEQLTSEYDLGKNYARFILEGRAGLEFSQDCVRKYNYRPFDAEHVYYDPKVVWRCREKVMQHLDDDSLSLVVCKQMATNNWSLVLAAHGLVDDCYVSNKTKERGYVFPLYLYTDNIDKVTKTPNLDAKIVAKIEKAVGKTTPEDIFNYIYAVLHTPEYRTKYKEFLKIDFPRIPYPKDAKTFKALVEKGAALVATHLLKSAAVTDDVAASDVAVFATEGANLVDKPTYANGSVKINREQAFANVPEKAWDFYIGGYQPAQKWLKDRKGRILSAEDVRHYRQIIHALLETDRLMGELSQLSGEWM